MIQSKTGQRVVGLLFLLVSGGFTVYSWYTVIHEGYYHRAAAVLFPTMAVAGLGLLFFPIDYDRLRREHGVEELKKFAHYPPEWKILFFVALAAGLGNWMAISQWQ